MQTHGTTLSLSSYNVTILINTYLSGKPNIKIRLEMMSVTLPSLTGRREDPVKTVQSICWVEWPTMGLDWAKQAFFHEKLLASPILVKEILFQLVSSKHCTLFYHYTTEQSNKKWYKRVLIYRTLHLSIGWLHPNILLSCIKSQKRIQYNIQVVQWTILL